MEINPNIEINQLIGLIKQLPADQKLKIKKEVDKELKENIKTEDNSGLLELLLDGPVMSKEEEQNFFKLNQEFEKWSKNLSA